MTDSTKATVWQATYKPFGEVQTTSGTKALNLRFPGQVFQIETAYATNWHRHYDPVSGRFTQPDPLRFIDGPSMYAYVGNSPYVWTDRDGRNPLLVPVLIGIGEAIGEATEAFCIRFPQLCANGIRAAGAATGAAIWEGCHWVYKKMTGSGGGNDDEEECDQQLSQEQKYCASRRNETALPGMYAACMDRAMRRYAACRTGKSGPPRWSVNDEEVWRNFGR